jgi:tRNA pseudouridine32 synthase/23S rRNA pseudouridine746 synthase
MDEDMQFFRMREVITDGSHSHNEFNSETWIDCVERIATQEIAIQTDGIKELALARYQLKPVTGQRHQLRVHMNSLGLPLLGDQFYPLVQIGADENDNFEHPLQLLAKSIFFKDPISDFQRSFASSLSLKILT